MGLSDFDKELLASNLVGATTLEQLYNKEKILTSAKMIALKETPILGQLDYQHLKDIHRFLFEDVYIWAGKDRCEAKHVKDFRISKENLLRITLFVSVLTFNPVVAETFALEKSSQTHETKSFKSDIEKILHQRGVDVFGLICNPLI